MKVLNVMEVDTNDCHASVCIYELLETLPHYDDVKFLWNLEIAYFGEWKLHSYGHFRRSWNACICAYEYVYIYRLCCIDIFSINYTLFAMLAET